jgi:hypothetical protein
LRYVRLCKKGTVKAPGCSIAAIKKMYGPNFKNPAIKKYDPISNNPAIKKMYDPNSKNLQKVKFIILNQ